MRGVLLFVAAALVVAGLVWFFAPGSWQVRPPILVGVIHSQSGPMEISEASMVLAERMAVDEINERGGLLGRRLKLIVADGRSDPAEFGREAARLIAQEKVSVLFGCWTSDCRKAVKEVVEREGHLLLYPVAYEGLEQSPNIVYTGAAPNQQVIPAVNWCRDVLRAKSFFLIGSDTVWPHSVNTIVKDQLAALGARPVGEEYLPFGTSDVEAAIAKVLAAKPDVVLSTIEGDTNLAFYRKLRGGRAPGGPTVPVVSFPVTEEELRKLPARDMVNDYLVCNYFQAIDRPENRSFVRRFKARFGADRVTSDAVATAYNSVILWSQAVIEAESDAVKEVRQALLRQSLDAPEGVISIDRESQHTYRPFFVGKVRADGQVDILFTLPKPIRPTPFPFSRTRHDWELFLDAFRPPGGAGRDRSNVSTGAVPGV